ncbi:hypothetical protein [Paenibacillus tritici]
MDWYPWGEETFAKAQAKLLSFINNGQDSLVQTFIYSE